MLKNKIFWTDALFSLGLFLVAKIMMAKQTEKVGQLEVQNATNQTNAVIGSYQGRYFKDTEYFGKNPIPSNYYQNWKLLQIMLDKIRGAFGSPVVIVSGYELPIGGVVTSERSQCREVAIYPQNNDYLGLANVVKTLVNSGQINPQTWVLQDNRTVKIII